MKQICSITFLYGQPGFSAMLMQTSGADGYTHPVSG
jgi:hypothetical protein